MMNICSKMTHEKIHLPSFMEVKGETSMQWKQWWFFLIILVLSRMANWYLLKMQPKPLKMYDDI